jgi:hypothetical protein
MCMEFQGFGPGIELELFAARFSLLRLGSLFRHLSLPRIMLFPEFVRIHWLFFPTLKALYRILYTPCRYTANTYKLNGYRSVILLMTWTLEDGNLQRRTLFRQRILDLRLE